MTVTKRFIWLFFAALLLLAGCFNQKKQEYISFGVADNYQPFVYRVNEKLQGFDIDLARAIAQELKLEARFKPMDFNELFHSLNKGEIDAAISAISIIPERMNEVDFSIPYHSSGLSMLQTNEHPITSPFEIGHRKIACLLDSSLELWLRKNAQEASFVLFDDEERAIDILKLGHIDGLLLENGRAAFFTLKYSKNAGIFTCSVIEESGHDYGIAFAPKSPLKKRIDEVLQKMQENGELTKLKNKWGLGN